MVHTPDRKEGDPSSSSSMLQCNTAVSTAYGDGKIIGYREVDQMYTVRLPFGTLHAVKESLLRRTPGVQVEAAFQSLEKMRKLNLEVHCHELGIPCDHDVCTICLLETAQQNNNHDDDQKSSSPWIILPNHRTKNKDPKNLKKGMPPCLICGSPTCPKHQSIGFKKQQIILCSQCERLFDLNFSKLLGLEEGESAEGKGSGASSSSPTKESPKAPKTIHTPTATRPPPQEIDFTLLETKIREMVDTYDRVMLLLTHASQFIPDLMVRLIATEARNNRIGFGTSSVGVLSGALGLAGAATILTPFGAPLLMASLALSGGSAAVTIGNEAVNYYQKPHEAADRILVMHGMVVSMLQAAKTLQRVALAVDPSWQNQNHPQNDNDNDDHKNKDGTAKIGETVGTGLTIIRKTETGINLANAAATSSAAISTAAPGATNLINTSASMLNAVPLLGTALSGIFIAMDANRMKDTLARINAGDPSDKAQSLHAMQRDLLLFPQAANLEMECQAYCEVIEKNMRNTAHD